jgi:hypothetical protein
VFSTCVDLIRTLPALPHDRTKAEDVDTHAEDHAPDALRYGLMSLRPVELKLSSPAGRSTVPRGSKAAVGRARVAMGPGAAIGRRR